MRMAFGLVSLLVFVAIMLWAMVGSGTGADPGYLQAVANANKQAKSQINVMSGYDPSRQMLATDSIHYRIDRTSGRPKLIVTEVMAGGPMEERFGLKPNDRVLEVGGLGVDMSITNYDDATAAFHDAYARNGTIVVMRGTDKIILPTPEHVAMIEKRNHDAAVEASRASAAANAPTVASTPSDDRSSIQKALDAARGQ